MLCPSFDAQRQDLLAGIFKLLRPVVKIADLSNDALTQLLLYGDRDLSNDLNRSIRELILRFIQVKKLSAERLPYPPEGMAD